MYLRPWGIKSRPPHLSQEARPGQSSFYPAGRVYVGLGLRVARSENQGLLRTLEASRGAYLLIVGQIAEYDNLI
jgi:hypothetical protein